MTSSFSGSAIEALINQAEDMNPDFSSKANPLPSDVEVFPAPIMMGKFLALMKSLELQEKFNQEDEGALKNLRADISLCAHLANRELRVAIQLHPLRKDMAVRNNGKVVIMLRTVSTAEMQLAVAAE